ncbi:MAG: energy-coupling factor transporter ATPase [Eubacteriales bacterium]
MGKPFISVKDLCFSYRDDDGNRIQVLGGISLDIEEGDFLAVIGHNGSGKSTFAKILNMILTPESGTLEVDGQLIDPDKMTDDDILGLRKNIGMVFQNPDNQLVATIVEDDVAFGPENLGVPSAEIRERVNRALSDVGMLGYAKHEPHRLSGGQKQRVAIAGIMAMLPRCIIFDESTAMLDPVGRREVLRSIEKLNREYGITVIMITHYMDEAVMANRVIVLDSGKVVLDGTPSYVFEKEDELLACGLAVPQCTALVHRLRRAGIKMDGDCLTPEQCAALIAGAFEA